MGGSMARNARKQFEAAEQLKTAAESGDQAAMWNYALFRLNMRPPAAGSHLNALPFLVRVRETLRDFGDHQTSDLIARAAQAGHTQAMVVVAELEERTDRAAAERLLTQAASKGDTAAMLYLGAMLETEDRAGAIQWLTRLAELGDSGGMYRLSKLLRTEGNLESAQGWLVRAAQAGHLKAQSDLSVQAFESGAARLDPAHPPARDPRRTGVFTSNSPASRKERLAADCVTCKMKTVQDHYELIVGTYAGLRGSGTTGKAGHRVNFSACAVCGCLFPMDDASRQYVNGKGGEFFNPAKLARNR
jgi:hypothetical protein